MRKNTVLGVISVLAVLAIFVGCCGIESAATDRDMWMSAGVACLGLVWWIAFYYANNC